MHAELSTLSLQDLRGLAKSYGLKGISALKKADLLVRLREYEASAPASDAAVVKYRTSSVKKAAEKDAAPAALPEKKHRGRPRNDQIAEPTAQEDIQTKAAAMKSEDAETSHPGEENTDTANKSGGFPAGESANTAATRQGRRLRSYEQPALAKQQDQSGRRSYNNENQQYRKQGRADFRRQDSRENRDYRMGRDSRLQDSRDSRTYQDAQEKEFREQRDYRENREAREREARGDQAPGVEDMSALDSGVPAHGILEVMPEGYGFIRCENYLPGDNDVYVSPTQIRRFNLKTGDLIYGSIRIKTGTEKFAALLYVKTINGDTPAVHEKRPNFEDLTPVFPDERIHLELAGGKLAMRVVDLFSPIGKGQRGMIVSPPKAGKTTLLKQIANSVTKNHPEMHVIILLIDERPEEVTDIKESIAGEKVEVIYSTFDELPEHHKRVSEMVIARAKRLVETGKEVMILLDSITRLARAYNLVVAPSGRTLSGGLDPSALYMPKKFFGAARNLKEGGSLTILATALVDTGSRMDDVVFEEFKGTGNMELVLDRKLSEKRIFPAIDIMKSGTRRDDLLLDKDEYETVFLIRKTVSALKPEEATEHILDLFFKTKTNKDFLTMARKFRWVQ